MHKSYSLRVLVLLGALIISAAYLLIIHFPLEEQLTLIKEESAAIEAKYDEETTRLMLRNTMQTAVNEVTEAANGRPVLLPEYDNRAIVMAELNDILEQTNSFSLDMQEAESGTLHMRRNISLSYQSASMTDALLIIGAIRSSPNKYIVTDLTISNGARDGEGSVSVSIKFSAFEYLKPATEPAAESVAE
jgi:cell division protein FtsL